MAANRLMTIFMFIATISIMTTSLSYLPQDASALVLGGIVDKNTFLSESGATSATGPLPNDGKIGTNTPVKYGTVTVKSISPSRDLFVGGAGVLPIGGSNSDWTSLIPGNSMAISDSENLEATFDNPVYAAGFEFVEPSCGRLSTACTGDQAGDIGANFATIFDSTFQVDLSLGGSAVHSFTYNAPDDTAAFVGVRGNMQFDKMVITEIDGESMTKYDNEYFGQFYTAESLPPAELCEVDENSNPVYVDTNVDYSPGEPTAGWEERQDETNALGPENYVQGGSTTFVSLGKQGSITLGFSSPVGGILSVYEITNGQWPTEKVLVEVSPDGTTWVPVGTASNDVASSSIRENQIDLVSAGYPGAVSQVRLTDISPMANPPGPDYFDVDAVSALPCIVPPQDCTKEYDLIAGQYYDMGTVHVTSDGTDLTIEIWADEGWQLDVTHVWAGDERADRPLTGMNNDDDTRPTPGQFDKHDEGIGEIEDHPDGTMHATHTLSIADTGDDDDTFFILVHAEVSPKEGSADATDIRTGETVSLSSGETAWGGGPPVNVGEPGAWWYYIVFTDDCEDGVPPQQEPEGTISGMKFDDKNGNGVKDAEDVGLGDWQIDLVCENGHTDSTNTDSGDTNTGSYVFLGIPVPTACTVTEVLQSGWTNTVSPAANFAVPDETPIVDKDFGNFKDVTIMGEKWEDFNGNGLDDDTDSRIAGWTIFLDMDGDLTGGADMQTTTADGSGDDPLGKYTFGPLGPEWAGTAFICEDLPEGWEKTHPSNDPDNAECIEVLIESSVDIPVSDDTDFGNFELVTIMGEKWEDTNGDGIDKDDDSNPEPRLGGWKIFLDKDNDDMFNNDDIPTTTADGTGADPLGKYTFGPLGSMWAGDRQICEELEIGWVNTHPDDVCIPITISSGNDLGATLPNDATDFGNVEPIQVVKTWTHTDYNWGPICWMEEIQSAVYDQDEFGNTIEVSPAVFEEQCRPANIYDDVVLAEPLNQPDPEQSVFEVDGQSNPKKGFQNTNPGAFFALTTVDVILDIDTLIVDEIYSDCTTDTGDQSDDYEPILQLLGSKKNIETALKAAVANPDGDVTELSAKDIIIGDMDDESVEVEIPGPIEAESKVFVLVKFQHNLSGDVDLPVMCDNMEIVTATIDGEPNSPFEAIVNAVLSIVEK